LPICLAVASEIALNGPQILQGLTELLVGSTSTTEEQERALHADANGNVPLGGSVILVPSSIEGTAPEAEYQLALPAGKDINSRSGDIVSSVTDKEINVYRIWGEENEKAGRWFSPNLPESANIAKDKLSLPMNNTAKFATAVTIPAGTRIETSVASPMAIWGTNGGWPQIEWIGDIPSSVFSGKTLSLK
jgi:hypothetical protein